MTRRSVFLAAFAPAVAVGQSKPDEITDIARIAMSISPRYIIEAHSPDVDYIIQDFIHWPAEIPVSVQRILYGYPMATQFTCLDLWDGSRRDIDKSVACQKRKAL